MTALSALYGLIVMRLSTLLTRGAAQVARSASSRSAHDLTVPRRMTSLPLASTVMRLASSSALRRKASSITPSLPFQCLNRGKLRSCSGLQQNDGQMSGYVGRELPDAP